LDENSTDVVVPVTGGETIVDIYANNYITQFIHFKDYF